MSSERITSRHPIRYVARRTGLKPELIRAWERRYQAVEPRRSPGGHRFYSDADVERLILLRRATTAGCTIGQIARLSDEELHRLLAEEAAPRIAESPASPVVSRLEACIAAITRLDARELSGLLDRASVDLGLTGVITELLVPLLQRIGELWHAGRLRPMHEHFASGVIRSFLSVLVSHGPDVGRAPNLIVATPSGQRHEIGALVAAAVAASQAWRVTYLGPDLPAEEIVAAARASDAQAVALSIIYPADDPHLGSEVLRMSRQLGPEIPVLLGGQAARAYAEAVESSRAIRLLNLDGLPEVLAHLRSPRIEPCRSSSPGPEVAISRQAWERHGLADLLGREASLADLEAIRTVVQRINDERDVARHLRAGELHALGLVWNFQHRLLDRYCAQSQPDVLRRALGQLDESFGRVAVDRAVKRFREFFPGAGEKVGDSDPEVVLEEMLLVWLANTNPAFEPFRELFDDGRLEAVSGYREMMASLQRFLGLQAGCGPRNAALPDLLHEPARVAPDSLGGQLRLVLALQEDLLPDQSTAALQIGLDVLREEAKPPFLGPGPAEVIEFDGRAVDEALFRPEPAWMSELVLLAKNVNVWLDQLTRSYGCEIARLDQVPDAELERLAGWGFTGLWLIGLWERSPASERIKQLAGNPEAAASAYALREYRIAASLGGEAAFEDLRDRAIRHGIRLSCDMVPNHMGIDSPWVLEHPERFLSLERSPFPSYAFTGEDLSPDPRVGIYLEDHYRDRSDAAVVFQRVERATGETRYVYHGNDGTGLPWNDTAQLDYLRGDVREAVLESIVEVARRFPIIRFDAAMTLAREHVARLWHPAPGQGGAIPSRSGRGISREEFERLMPEEFWRQVVERVAAEAPETLLLAEAFWMMEGYFVRELGLHRVYNSAFMHMLRDEDNVRFRGSLANALALDPRILQRFVHFLTTPDEATAIEQFGKGDKYFALCTLLATLPGLPLFGHGQIEGLLEKYGMEYRRAAYSEEPDRAFVARHEREIVPLLKRRRLFAGVDGFHLYELTPADGEDAAAGDHVFAFSNREDSQRVLVLVHNRRATVRGVVHRAVPYRDWARGDLVRDTLGAALGLTGAPDTFCHFRDLRSGLEYCHSGRELCERGLEVELGPYDYRVLVDVREVRDEAGRSRRHVPFIKAPRKRVQE